MAAPKFRNKRFETWRPVPYSSCLLCGRVCASIVHMQVVSIVLPGSAFSLETLTYLSPLCFDINVLIVTGQVHLSHIFHIIIYIIVELDIYVRMLRTFLSFGTQGFPWFSTKNRTIIRAKHVCASSTVLGRS